MTPPVPFAFAIAGPMSHGARNCPFFTFTGRPVAAAATSMSVCRDSIAGTWRRSTTEASRAACSGVWKSVVTGSPVCFFTLARIARPSSSPGPRNDVAEVRFALSNDDL
jgi:hypothetical protein